MAINIPRGGSNPAIESIIEGALVAFQHDHPQAEIDLYSQNPGSVRIRIIDPGFADQTKSQRNHFVWQYLRKLPDESQADISMLVLLVPGERTTSFANLEFDDPVPSIF